MKQKRSLGQNFFINEHLGEKIINLVLEEKSSNITEIGPGDGFFTGKLQEKVRTVSIIEKDDNLAKVLSYKYKNIKVYNKDFLDFDLSKLQNNTLFFGSLPYNVSKPIIKKILLSDKFTNPAFFIIQKEVAEKYIAQKPNNNILSLLAQSYSVPQRLFDIQKDSFRPQPKVTSTFIKFIPKKNVFIPDGFENFLHSAFTHPRKTLKNNLKVKKEYFLLKRRPSELSLEEYLQLFKENLI